MIWQYVIAIIASALFSILFQPKVKETKRKNEISREGVDHDLDILYGKRRIGLTVTDEITSRDVLNPDSQAAIANVIRSVVKYKGRDSGASDSKSVTLVRTGPLCLAGRLNAPFAGADPADVSPLVNEKDYDDPTLVSMDSVSAGSAFELHLVGGVRHPYAAAYNSGDNNTRYSGLVSATATYYLNIEKKIAYNGKPDLTFELVSNALYDVREFGVEDPQDPGTWSGRPDNAVLQLMDYMLRDDFGAAIDIADFDISSWQLAAEISDVPTSTTVTSSRSLALPGQYLDTYSIRIVTKASVPGYVFESNILLSTEDDLTTNIEQLLGACRGAALFKNRAGAWAIQPDWLHEDDLTQVITGETGTGPFPMDWPTTAVRVYKNSAPLLAGFSVVASASLVNIYRDGVLDGTSGTDPDGAVGISFTVPLLATDQIEIDYLQDATENPGGIPGMPTAFHIVDDPETIGRDYDAERDINGVLLVEIKDPGQSQLSPVKVTNRHNRCVLKFPDSETLYKQNQVTWPEPGSAIDLQFMSEDNQQRHVNTISVNHITTKEKALDYAEFLIRKSRSTDRLQYLLAPDALQMDPRDTVLVHDRRLNINGELWRVLDTDPQEDLNCMVWLERYDREDYTFAVEAFAQEAVRILNRLLGPVGSLAIDLAETNGILGSGRLTWTPPDGAQVRSYVSAVSLREAWQAQAYAQDAEVYHDQRHWTAGSATGAGQEPGIDAAWIEIEEDETLWYTFLDSASLSSTVPFVTEESLKAYRVQGRNEQGFGEPAYLVQLIGVQVADQLLWIIQEDTPVGGQYEVGLVWTNPATGVQNEWDGSFWVPHTPPDPDGLRLAGQIEATQDKFDGAGFWCAWDHASTLPLYNYEIQFLWDTGAGLEYRYTRLSECVLGTDVASPQSAHSYQDSIDLDPDLGGGEPAIRNGSRVVTVRVYTIAPDLVTRSASYTERTFSNDQMDALVGVAFTLVDRSLEATHDPVAGGDFAGVEIHGSNVSGYSPDETTLLRSINTRTGHKEIRTLLAGLAGVVYLRMGAYDVWGAERGLMDFSPEVGIVVPADFGGLAYKGVVDTDDIADEAVKRRKVAPGDLIQTTVLNLLTWQVFNPLLGAQNEWTYSFTAAGDGVIVFDAFFTVLVTQYGSAAYADKPWFEVLLQAQVNGGGFDVLTPTSIYSLQDTGVLIGGAATYEGALSIVGNSDYQYFDPVIAEGDTVEFRMRVVYFEPDNIASDNVYVVDPVVTIREFNNT